MIWVLLSLFKNLKGIGFWVLQFFRVATIIALTASAASCWVLMIKVSKSRTYFVFECMSLFFTSIACVVLILSEVPVLKFIRRYFRNTWPVLSETHGIGWLGVAMIVIGCNILGSLNQPAYDHKHIGGHFSALIIASGILSLTFGALNILGGFIWRDGKDGITSRDIRAHGSLAKKREQLPSYNGSPASSIRNEKRSTMSAFWHKIDSKQKGRPIISEPILSHQNPGYTHPDEDRTSPIVPGIQRPSTALHPMHTGHSGRSSHYSVANMKRFS